MPVDAGGGAPPPPSVTLQEVTQHSDKDDDTMEISRVHLNALCSQLDALSKKVETLESTLGKDVRSILALLREGAGAGGVGCSSVAATSGWIVGEVSVIKGSEVICDC